MYAVLHGDCVVRLAWRTLLWPVERRGDDEELSVMSTIPARLTSPPLSPPPPLTGERLMERLGEAVATKSSFAVERAAIKAAGTLGDRLGERSVWSGEGNAPTRALAPTVPTVKGQYFKYSRWALTPPRPFPLLQGSGLSRRPALASAATLPRRSSSGPPVHRAADGPRKPWRWQQGTRARTSAAPEPGV